MCAPSLRGANGTYSACRVVSWIVYWSPLSANFSTVASASLGKASRPAAAVANTAGIVAIPQPTPRRASRRGVTATWKTKETMPVPA